MQLQADTHNAELYLLMEVSMYDDEYVDKLELITAKMAMLFEMQIRNGLIVRNNTDAEKSVLDEYYKLIDEFDNR